MSTLDCPGTTPTFRIRRASAQSCQGQIQLIIGPMFSGKSTELIRRLKRYEIARYECLIVKYARDVRYDRDGIATHDRMSLSAAGATRLAEMGDRARGYDVIGVDEGQFVSIYRVVVVFFWAIPPPSHPTGLLNSQA